VSCGQASCNQEEHVSIENSSYSTKLAAQKTFLISRVGRKLICTPHHTYFLLRYYVSCWQKKPTSGWSSWKPPLRTSHYLLHGSNSKEDEFPTSKPLKYIWPTTNRTWCVPSRSLAHCKIDNYWYELRYTPHNTSVNYIIIGIMPHLWLVNWYLDACHVQLSQVMNLQILLVRRPILSSFLMTMVKTW